MARVFIAQAYQVQLLFLKDGPLRREFEALSIECGPLNAPLIRPDLVIANTVLAVPASNLLRKHGIRVVNWVHESKWFLDALKIDPVRAGFAEVTEVLVPSQFMVQELSDFFPNALFAVLPNQVKAAEGSKKGSTGRVIVPGSWETRKGQQHLLALMSQAGVKLPITFLGATNRDSPNLSEFEFTGQVSHLEALDRIASAKMLICPALSETQNLSALEAIAREIPVVLSDIPAHRELSQYLGGIPLFDLRSPSAFLASIKRAQDDARNPSLLTTRAKKLSGRFGEYGYRSRVLSLIKLRAEAENVRDSRTLATKLKISDISLSVVTVVLEANEELDKSRRNLQSLVDQEKDLEWIVKSAKPIDLFASGFTDHPRIRVIHEHDSGIYEAMNQAVRHARGKYLLFLGAGDWLLEKNLQFLMGVLRNAREIDIPLIFFAAQMESWGRVWYPNPAEFEQRMSSPHGSMLMLREEVVAAGGYNQGYRIAGDYDLISRILKMHGASLLWQSPRDLSFCDGNGVSVRKFLEAYLEECLVRMRIWGKKHEEMGSNIKEYIDNPFQLLLKRELSRI